MSFRLGYMQHQLGQNILIEPCSYQKLFAGALHPQHLVVRLREIVDGLPCAHVGIHKLAAFSECPRLPDQIFLSEVPLQELDLHELVNEELP